MASTTMNVASSRSHTLLVLTLLRREGLGDEGNENTGSSRPCREVISQLSLVDLAGSERSSRELREGKSSTRFHEAVNVNQSLFVLRRVITALSKRETNSKSDVVHVPYRESKLTSLLQNSLGGNSYLVMFACLAPSEKQDDENLSTLQYASQAACIRNQPMVNLDPKDQLIQQLEARLAVAHDYLRRALQVSELPEDLLEQENRAAEAAGTGRRRPRPPRTQPSNTPRKLKSHRQTTQTTQTAQTADGSSAQNGLGQNSRAKTWTGTEQRWGFQDQEEKGAKAKITEVMGSQGSESSRESSKSRAKNLKKPPGYDRSDKGEAATATLSRIVQGRRSSLRVVGRIVLYFSFRRSYKFESSFSKILYMVYIYIHNIFLIVILHDMCLILNYISHQNGHIRSKIGIEQLSLHALEYDLNMYHLGDDFCTLK